MKNIIKILALVSTLGVASTATAQIPYQGRLTDSAGNPPVDGTSALTFRIFTEATGGQEVWGPKEHNVSTVNGRFALNIGPEDDTAAARDIGIAIRNGGRFLQITSGNGTTSSRQAILPAPRALIADGAKTALQVQDGDTLFVNGTNNRVGIGTSSPSAPLHVSSFAIPSGGTNLGALLVGAPGVANTAIGVNQIQGLVNGTPTDLSLQPHGGTLRVGGAATIGSALTVTGSVLANGSFQQNGPFALFGGGDVRVENRGANGSGDMRIGTNAVWNTGESRQIFFGDRSLVTIGETEEDDVMTLRAKDFHFTNGKVGIGTKDPTVPLEVKGGQTVAGEGNDIFSLRLEHQALADEYDTFSDARIKKVIGISDSALDLGLLSQIEITDYTHLDPQKGKKPTKKVIAQQVEQIFPQAVSKIRNAVADILADATVDADGWIELDTDLAVGERVLLKVETSSDGHEVLEIRDGAFRTGLKAENTMPVFVFGREVDDFRTVDYSEIAMLNVSATQELARQIDAKDATISALELRISALETQAKARDAQFAAALKRLEGATQVPVSTMVGNTQ